MPPVNRIFGNNPDPFSSRQAGLQYYLKHVGESLQPGKIDLSSKITFHGQEISVKEKDGVLSVDILGSSYLDTPNYATDELALELRLLDRSIKRQEGAIKKVILNFHNVDFMSTGGIGFLFVLRKSLNIQGIELELNGVQPQLYDVFKVTKLNQIFNIHPLDRKPVRNENQDQAQEFKNPPVETFNGVFIKVTHLTDTRRQPQYEEIKVERLIDKLAYKKTDCKGHLISLKSDRYIDDDLSSYKLKDDLLKFMGELEEFSFVEISFLGIDYVESHVAETIKLLERKLRKLNGSLVLSDMSEDLQGSSFGMVVRHLSKLRNSSLTLIAA